MLFMTCLQTSAASICTNGVCSPGSVQQHIKEWDFLGPFPIGKNELDGDPTEFYGGIDFLHREYSSNGKNQAFWTELVKNGQIGWNKINSDRGVVSKSYFCKKFFVN